MEATQHYRTTALSICPLACHPFTSNCISLTLSSCRLWISQDLSWPGVDSNHQDRQQEKQNKFFLHGQAVYRSVTCSYVVAGAQMRANVIYKLNRGG